MEMIAPSGPVYQAGTLSGNPLAMTAGIETLGELRRSGVWDQLEATASSLVGGLADAAGSAGVRIRHARVGTMFGVFFADEPVVDWDSASRSDTEKFARYHTALLDAGVYVAPSQYEAAFISSAHGETEIDFTLAAAERVFASL
jgi:glutamate-1-semialdehyde 2,1-aminomutase